MKREHRNPKIKYVSNFQSIQQLIVKKKRNVVTGTTRCSVTIKGKVYYNCWWQHFLAKVIQMYGGFSPLLKQIIFCKDCCGDCLDNVRRKKIGQLFTSPICHTDNLGDNFYNEKRQTKIGNPPFLHDFPMRRNFVEQKVCFCFLNQKTFFWSR